MNRFPGLLAFIVFALASISRAAPVTYNESIDGDLPADGPPLIPLPTLTLDSGVNTIKGQLETRSDFDSFGVIVPAGFSVTGGSIALHDVSGGDWVASFWRLRSGSPHFNSGSFVGDFVVDSPGEVPIGALGPNTYNFSQQSNVTFGDGVAEYLFTLNVVPEPASLGLLALAGVALIRRRHI